MVMVGLWGSDLKTCVKAEEPAEGQDTGSQFRCGPCVGWPVVIWRYLCRLASCHSCHSLWQELSVGFRLKVAPAVGSPAARPVDPRGIQSVPIMPGVVYVLCYHGYHLGPHMMEGTVIYHSSLASLGSLGRKPHLFLLQSCSIRRVHNLSGRRVEHHQMMLQVWGRQMLMPWWARVFRREVLRNNNDHNTNDTWRYPAGLRLFCVCQGLVLHILHG